MLLSDLLIEKPVSGPATIETGRPKAFFFNILRANYFLPIFYLDFLRRPAANSSVLKDLEIQSGIFFCSGSILQPGQGQTLHPSRAVLRVSAVNLT